MKKLFLVLALVLTLGLFSSGSVIAQDEVVVCPQPYGGGVVCGVKTHEPVETGLAENLGLVGVLALGASIVMLRFSKKVERAA